MGKVRWNILTLAYEHKTPLIKVKTVAEYAHNTLFGLVLTQYQIHFYNIKSLERNLASYSKVTFVQAHRE